MNKIDEFLHELEKLRLKLQRLIEDKEIRDPEILQLSGQLEQLLHKYEKTIKNKMN